MVYCLRDEIKITTLNSKGKLKLKRDWSEVLAVFREYPWCRPNPRVLYGWHSGTSLYRWIWGLGKACTATKGWSAEVGNTTLEPTKSSARDVSTITASKKLQRGNQPQIIESTSPRRVLLGHVPGELSRFPYYQMISGEALWLESLWMRVLLGIRVFAYCIRARKSTWL